MAIHPQPRENLLVEATAFPRRFLFKEDAVPEKDGCPQEIFIGLRETGAFSVYFDEQPVLQFNNDHELRRVYAKRTKYSAEQGRLVELTRSKQGGHVQLNRAPMGLSEQESMLVQFVELLNGLKMALADGSISLAGYSTPDVGIVQSIPPETYAAEFERARSLVGPIVIGALPLRIANSL